MNLLTNYYRADTSAIAAPKSDGVLRLNVVLFTYTFRLLGLLRPPLSMMFQGYDLYKV